MHIQWFGQSAFQLVADDQTIFIDPFDKVDDLRQRGIHWLYPPIVGVRADLLLVTHEHGDHNGVEVIGGSPRIIRSTAGVFESDFGKVTAIASEHDQVAGTQLGPNTIFVLEFAGLRVCHFGDFGQAALRPEQQQAIGEIDLLFLPVGGVLTIDGETSATIMRQLRPRWTVPMHYRTPAIDFLGPIDPFLEAAADTTIRQLSSPTFNLADWPATDGPVIIVPAPPTPA